MKEIEARDLQDSGRGEAPLIKAKDAELLDTTFLTFEESVDRMIDIISEKTGLKFY
jgi:cytidylate kinase